LLIVVRTIPPVAGANNSESFALVSYSSNSQNDVVLDIPDAMLRSRMILRLSIYKIKFSESAATTAFWTRLTPVMGAIAIVKVQLMFLSEY